MGRNLTNVKINLVFPIFYKSPTPTERNSEFREVKVNLLWKIIVYSLGVGNKTEDLETETTRENLGKKLKGD